MGGSIRRTILYVNERLTTKCRVRIRLSFNSLNHFIQHSAAHSARRNNGGFYSFQKRLMISLALLFSFLTAQFLNCLAHFADRDHFGDVNEMVLVSLTKMFTSFTAGLRRQGKLFHEVLQVLAMPVTGCRSPPPAPRRHLRQNREIPSRYVSWLRLSWTVAQDS
jgi:hypothetical protein